jgi:hypothetical protein
MTFLDGSDGGGLVSTMGAAAAGPAATTTDLPSTTTASANHASMKDDPHVCTLSGECYDIRAPSEYTLLRLPYSEQEPASLKLSADLDTDGVRSCGLFVKHVALSGSSLGGQIVRVRPHTRNVGGSNSMGDMVMTNFSYRLGNSAWRSFTHNDSLHVVGQLGVRFVWREQYGQRVEAQSLEISVGEGRHSAVISISQASHQALNIDMWGMGRLGHSRMGGVLGTEGHLASIEKPTLECRAARAEAKAEEMKMRRVNPAPPELASTLKVSWE